MCAELLRAVEQEPVTSVRHKVCDTVGELAVVILEKGQWVELLPQLLAYAKSPDAGHRESGYLIFAQLSGYLPNLMKTFYTTLVPLYQEALADAQSVRVRVAALMATTTMLTALDPQEREGLTGLIPTMLETILAGIMAHEDESTRSALEVLINLAEVEPTFLRTHLQLVVQSMVQMASNANLDDSFRHLAMEFLNTLAENATGTCLGELVGWWFVEGEVWLLN